MLHIKPPNPADLISGQEGSTKEELNNRENSEIVV
jgi:hypothetical protein